MRLPFIGNSQPGTPADLQPRGTKGTGTWADFLSKPENKTALLQFGVSMLTGNSGNFLSNVGAAVGDAGGAVARVKEGKLAKQKAETEQAAASQKSALDQAKFRLDVQKAQQQAAHQGGMLKVAQQNAATAAANAAKGNNSSAANDKAWRTFVMKAMSDAVAVGETVTLADLQAQWEAMGFPPPSGMVAAPQLTEPAKQRVTIDGKAYEVDEAGNVFEVQ